MVVFMGGRCSYTYVLVGCRKRTPGDTMNPKIYDAPLSLINKAHFAMDHGTLQNASGSTKAQIERAYRQALSFVAMEKAYRSSK